MDPMIVPYVVLIGGIVVARFVSEAGLKSLSALQKAAVIDSFASVRKYGLLVFLVLLLAAYRYPAVLLGLVVLFLGGNYVVTLVKLRKLDVPRRYRHMVWGSSAISAASVGLFLYLQWGINRA